MIDEFVEVFEVEEKRPDAARRKEVRAAVEKLQDDLEFDKRLANWRSVVLGSGGGGGSGFCAGWARLYVQTRDERARQAMIQRYGSDMVLLMMPGSTSSTRIAVDELDGWLVETAVRSLADFNERKVLQYWYVWQYPEHWIKSKLLLRRGGVRLFLSRARTNLKNILRSANYAANIPSNNLQAGVDPRLESKDAP